jgi:hypothetical protein
MYDRKVGIEGMTGMMVERKGFSGNFCEAVGAFKDIEIDT